MPRARTAIPKEIMPVVAILSAMEGDMMREGMKFRSFGSIDMMTAYMIGREDFSDDLDAKEPKRRLPEGVATIPGGRGGPCQPILVVFMGEHESHDVLLLEALEYIAARCRRFTKYVIFHAASWSAYAWVAHREAFSLSGVIPILKLVGSEPIPLDPPS